MALTEETNYDKIEVVGTDKFGIQLRQATVIKKDGEQVSKTFHRTAITHGYYSPDGTYNQTDISVLPADVQAIINATWTSDVVTKWKASPQSLNPNA
tara:strand:+ start:1099 stop:1389 length:291 start_codon:yes stop_codon:yes gene_type:complete